MLLVTIIDPNLDNRPTSANRGSVEHLDYILPLQHGLPIEHQRHGISCAKRASFLGSFPVIFCVR